MEFGETVASFLSDVQLFSSDGVTGTATVEGVTATGEFSVIVSQLSGDGRFAISLPAGSTTDPVLFLFCCVRLLNASPHLPSGNRG